MIQNVQDFLEYAESTSDDLDKAVFFQGWACGPCRYGLYASAQSLLMNRAGLGEQKVYAAKLFDLIRQFGLGFAVGLFDGSAALDTLYRMLHATRPYELEAGRSEAVFERYSDALMQLLKRYRFRSAAVIAGRHLWGFEELVRAAAAEFAAIPRTQEERPIIVVAGEFYVRLDDRCNQDVIRKIEGAGGEVTLSPATELFAYTGYINYHEARTVFRQSGQIGALFQQLGFAGLNKLALRDEMRISHAADEFLECIHEPAPKELREMSRRYISEHYGGEPPMTVGRTCALAKRGAVHGAVMVAPFTCMPGSVVEAQLSVLRRDLGIPMVATYYDGKDNPSREELIQGLVFQAKQKLSAASELAAGNG